MIHTCETCRFYEYLTPSIGICRRHAPRPGWVPRGQGKHVVWWPEVGPGFWCGEWADLYPKAPAGKAVPCSTEDDS